MNHHITTGAPPYHAYFEHPDGSWYMLWMTRTFPKTSRGHPWHVHIRWNKWGGRKPARNWPWWERLWGKANRDFHDPNKAVNEFYFNRYLPRIEHGYELIEGHLAPGWPLMESKVKNETRKKKNNPIILLKAA